MNKIAGIGCAAGVAAACIPSALGYAKSKDISLFNDDSFLSCKGSDIVNAKGEVIRLRCIIPNGNIPDLSIREALFKRFGAYGEAQLVRVYGDSFLSLADISCLAKDGFNCVELTFDRCMLYSSKIKGAPDFEKLDSIINHCKKVGVYVILNLHCVTAFDEKSKKKDKSEKIFKKLWNAIAAHYANEPAVAAYDLYCSSLFDNAHLNENESALGDYYLDINKIIRKKDNRHIVIIRRIFEHDITEYKPEDFGNGTAIAYDAAYSSSLELKSKLASTAFPACPCFILSSVLTRDILESVDSHTLTPVFTSFKACNSSQSLYSFTCDADFEQDSFDVITEKFTTCLKTENCSKINELTPVDSEKATIRKPRVSYTIGYRSGRKLQKISNQGERYED